MRSAIEYALGCSCELILQAVVCTARDAPMPHETRYNAWDSASALAVHGNPNLLQFTIFCTRKGAKHSLAGTVEVG